MQYIIGVKPFEARGENPHRSVHDGKACTIGSRNQSFGLYELAGKVTFFIGPLVLGLATQGFDSKRAGISTILIFLLAGIFMLLPLDEPPRPNDSNAPTA